MTSFQEIDERTNLTANNKFELLLFRLGQAKKTGRSELFGINVFKVREIMVMPKITKIVNASPDVIGVTDIRGQVITVIDLPKIMGCTPSDKPKILLVTEYSRTTQGFAVEEVNEIVRLEWNQVMTAEDNGGNLITSIAKLEHSDDNSKLVQVLDVEQILRDTLPPETNDITAEDVGPSIRLPDDAVILAADDSFLARSMIEKGLTALGTPYIMCKNGEEAWEKMQSLAASAQSEGKTARDKVAMILTDLEMPKMDGFTLTRKIKSDQRFSSIPVVIQSSLTGTTNEDHVKSVGADAYVAKFVAEELAATIRKVLTV